VLHFEKGTVQVFLIELVVPAVAFEIVISYVCLTVNVPYLFSSVALRGPAALVSIMNAKVLPYAPTFRGGEY
jgi:hypothetical protein